jgi:hypothetical protein
MIDYQRNVRRLKNRLINPILARQARGIARNYRIAGKYQRVYHYHVRKTEGTSLNSAFLGLIDYGLKDYAGRSFIQKDGFIFINHDKSLIEQGNYFFAHSHYPAHELKLPERTFTITVLRNPLDRLMSYYSYLVWARDAPDASKLEPAFAQLRKEMRWLGQDFGDFVELLPREHLLNQLYMFSAGFSVPEAVKRIAACNFVLFTSHFADDLAHLSHILYVALKLKWERRFGKRRIPSLAELQKAHALLAPEYDLLRELGPKRGKQTMNLPRIGGHLC